MTRTLVIGAGVVGLASAYELRKRGEEVVVVDRGAPGEGCSRGNAGWLVPSLGEPLAAPGLTWTSLKWMLTRDSPLHIDPLAAPSMAGWLWNFWRHCNAADYRRGCAVWGTVMAGVMRSFDALASEGVEFEMHAQGLLFVFLSADAMRHVLKAMTEAIAGVRDGLQPLGATEVRAMEPGLSARVQGGIMASGERHVRPESLSAGLARRLSGMGVTVRSGVEVTGGVRRGDRVVGVRAGPEIIEGDRVLVAAGANSGQLTDLIAGVPLPVQAGKGYSVTISAMRAPFARPLYLDEARVGCSPFDGGYRLAGTMELSGINERLVPSRVAAIRRAATRYFHEPQPMNVGTEWVGMRPITPDGLPIMGSLPGHPNVYVATGHGMLGVTCCAVTGSLMAELIVDGKPSVDLSPMDPARFARR